MELKPQFWITVKLRYKSGSSVTLDSFFLQRHTPFFLPCRRQNLSCNIEELVGNVLTQVPHLHSLQSNMYINQQDAQNSCD